MQIPMKRSQRSSPFVFTAHYEAVVAAAPESVLVRDQRAPGTTTADARSPLMDDSPHLIDARRLIDAFAETDAIIPPLVFALLSLYLREGSFQFDASALAEKLTLVNPAVRVNAERLAAMQPELERFFAPGPTGWAPRAGVLTYESGVHGGGHTGEIPGESAGPIH